MPWRCAFRWSWSLPVRVVVLFNGWRSPIAYSGTARVNGLNAGLTLARGFRFRRSFPTCAGEVALRAMAHAARMRSPTFHLLIAACIVIALGGCVHLQEKPGKPEAILDHFLCHSIGGELPDPPDVVLRDQFPIEDANRKIAISDRAFLCNPVEKTHGDRKFERKRLESHLVCYRLGGTSYERHVEIENQLEPRPVKATLDTQDLLCLPSGKSETREPKPIPTDLNHFKCYHAKEERSSPVALHLKDQFVD